MGEKRTYLAAVWNAPGDIRLEEKTLRDLEPGELLLKVKVAGICGTDLHLIEGKYPNCFPPVVPGHEFAGIIEAAGSEEDEWLIRKRVGGDSYIGCGKCVFCLGQELQLCESGVRELGVHLDGAWAEYLILPKENIYILPDNVSFEEAGIGCILNCPMAAIEKICVRAGDFVLILGDGPSSLILTQLAKLKGAEIVVVTGHREKRLRLAAELGADMTIDTYVQDIENCIEKYGKEPNVVIDAVGRSETLNQAVQLAGKKGRIHLFGLPTSSLSGIEMEHFLFKELLLTSSTGNPALWQSTAMYLSKGLVNVKPLISHRFELGEINSAIDFIKSNPKEVVKTIIVIE